MPTNVAADLLRTARQRAHVTQTELAARSGITQPVISAYERGRRQPSVEALNRLVRALGFRLELVGTGEARPSPAEAGRRLAEALELAEALPYIPTKTMPHPPFAGGPSKAIQAGEG